ncbi:MAG: DUF333 domain-containing protein, partial [Candidatus Eisenbacteria bacterium]|nr:DUF333 domain-containing protein [Candidatus Eisenbacteria bacterium]
MAWHPRFSLVSHLLLTSVLLWIGGAMIPAVANGPSGAADGPTALGAVNPAALYCELLGYEYVIIPTAGGERGYCRLPDGQRVDAWDFFRGKCAQQYGYCAREGYETHTIDRGTGRYEAECAVCVDAQGIVQGSVAELMGLYESPPFEAAGVLASPLERQAGGSRRGAGAVSTPPRRDLSEAFDWREHDGCTPIKNQGSCGSCWAFSTVAPLECGILIQDGIEEDLSEQYLVSCNSDGWSCGGGWYAHNYHMWKPDPCGDVGPVLEADFPYMAQDLPCDCPYTVQPQYRLRLWDYVGETGGIPPV